MRADGQTVVFVAADGKVAGLIAVTDPVKQTTPEAIRKLHEEGVRVVMLTGDSRTTAAAVARKLHMPPAATGLGVETDEASMGPALHLIARLYMVEDRAKALSLSAEQRLALRKRVSARLLEKLHKYLLELQSEVLPKSPSGAAVRYSWNQWAGPHTFSGRR